MITVTKKVEHTYTISGLSFDHLQVIAALTGRCAGGFNTYNREGNELFNVVVDEIEKSAPDFEGINIVGDIKAIRLALKP